MASKHSHNILTLAQAQANTMLVYLFLELDIREQGEKFLCQFVTHATACVNNFYPKLLETRTTNHLDLNPDITSVGILDGVIKKYKEQLLEFVYITFNDPNKEYFNIIKLTSVR